MRSNAVQFFDIWCAAVEYAHCRWRMPDYAPQWSEVVRSRIEPVYGTEAAERALIYASQLYATASPRGIT